MYRSVFLVFVYAVGLEGLRIRGSSDPLVAQLGGSVLLPCFIESPLPLEDLQVKWRKMEKDLLVSVFQQGENRPDLQSQQFRGRVGIFPEEILKGNFSILLKNVVEEDAGGYRCQVNTSQGSSEVVLEIKDIKSLVVTGADRAVFAREGDDVVLNCSVDSHVPASEIEEVAWKRIDRDQEILVLLYQDNEIFPDSSHERYRGRVDLFSSEIPKGNFSLKLTDVKMEDKGEFTCEVHTRNMSGRTVVLLQGVGFSALHLAILVLCSVAVLLAVGFCGPVFIQLKNNVTTTKVLTMQIVLIVCPNICMFVAYCLWSAEGFLIEVVGCSSISLIRPFMVMKTSPYLSRLPRHLKNSVKALAVPFYNSILPISACSFLFSNAAQIQTAAGYAVIVLILIAVLSVIIAVVLVVRRLWMRMFMFLDLFNAILLGLLLSSFKENFEYILEIPSVVPPLIMGLMMVLNIQRHFFQGKVFDCLHITLSSVIVAVFSFSEICVFIILFITSKTASVGWILIFEAVMFLCAWLGVIYLLRCHQGTAQQRCCSHWRKTGYICCMVIAAFLLIAYFIYMCLRHMNIFKNEKDSSGYVSLLVFVHILATTCMFKHPKYLPGVLHIMIFMFGAVGLTAVNALALIAELILKAEKGARTIGDLRVIVFSLETVFVSAWLILQIYDAWIRLKDRTKRNFETETRPGHEVIPEMMVLSETIPNPASTV